MISSIRREYGDDPNIDTSGGLKLATSGGLFSILPYDAGDVHLENEDSRQSNCGDQPSQGETKQGFFRWKKMQETGHQTTEKWVLCWVKKREITT